LGSKGQVPTQDYIDSLNQRLRKTVEDTNRVKLLLEKGDLYFFTKPDSTRIITEEALQLAEKLNFLKGQIQALNNVAEAYRFVGDYPLALKMNFEALQLNRQMKDIDGEASSLGFIGFDYLEFREYRKGLEYLLESYAITKSGRNKLKLAFDLTNIANAYNLLNKPDSGLYYSKLSFENYQGLTHGPLQSLILTRTGAAFSGLGNTDSAFKYFRMALANSIKVNEKVNLSKIQLKMAELFERNRQYDSSLYYARRSFLSGQQSAQRLELLVTSELLTRLFKQMNNIDSAFFYQDVAKKMTDSLYGPQKFKELQLLMLNEQQRQQEAEQDKEQFKNRTKTIALLSVVGIILIIAFILYRNNRQKQKVNNILETTLSNLKATQSQLVQSEKMASLGELTAGIAHEIQNPLNFVNNFSEVNDELLKELKAEAEKGNLEEVKAIAKDIAFNSEKINHHGKRADGIVKGMLQHSRTNTGQKEPTDINALADEYLRLAYHGIRAKDKSFNARTETDFDTNIGKVNVIPQDMGRVILYLINNAFYAVDEKKKQIGDGYEPTVSVSTKKINGKVEIKIADNGNGIPQKVLDKVFQPFFTTKPTGQGTGLGLSLSYDIIKAHGGEIKVETKEGEGTAFIVLLPINQIKIHG
jgi:signal transduction histidine kinase